MAASRLQTVVVTWEPGRHWWYRLCETYLYTLVKKEGRGRGRSKQAIAQRKKIQEKLELLADLFILLNIYSFSM